MKDDYLWDRTGEPDPEIHQLEHVLRTLRYQPRPLEIPARGSSVLKASLFRRFAPRFAMAVTIAMMLLGLGIWLGWQRQQPAEIAKTQSGLLRAPIGTHTRDPNKNAEGNTIEDNRNGTVVSSGTPDQNRAAKSGRHRIKQRMFARDTARARRPTLEAPPLAADELREAEAAKVQLMLALRVASSKLNFAQRKTQVASPENMFHNQHKIG